KTGFGCLEDKAKHVENRDVCKSCCARDRRNEGECRRHNAPGDHNPGDPALCADAFEENVGRHLKQKIRNEEQSGAQSESRFAKTKRLVHMKLCEADIDAIKIGNEVTQNQKRYQTP